METNNDEDDHYGFNRRKDKRLKHICQIPLLDGEERADARDEPDGPSDRVFLGWISIRPDVKPMHWFKANALTTPGLFLSQHQAYPPSAGRSPPLARQSPLTATKPGVKAKVHAEELGWESPAGLVRDCEKLPYLIETIVSTSLGPFLLS